MKATELRDLDDKGLREHVATQRRELFGLRLQHATGQLDNHSRLQHLRRDIARINTALRQREIAAAEAEPRAVRASTKGK